MAALDKLFQNVNKKKKTSKLNAANFLENAMKQDEYKRKKQEEEKKNEALPQRFDNPLINNLLLADDDWKPVVEFEEKEIIDTTNLRVQNLDTTKTAELIPKNDEREIVDIEMDDDEESKTTIKSWATKLASGVALPSSDAENINVVARDASQSNENQEVDLKTNSAYVPPHLAGSDNNSNLLYVRPKFVKPQIAPNFGNVDEFPSLGDLNIDESNRKKDTDNVKNDNSDWIDTKTKKSTFVEVIPNVTANNVYIPAHLKDRGLTTVSATHNVANNANASNAGEYVPPNRREGVAQQGLKLTKNKFAT